MIARLEGTLIRDGEHVIVDCNGVGYELTCSAYTIAALPASGERVTLRVYTQMRETAIALFGFVDAQERDLFDLLITVKNVGPTTAIAILSGSSPRDIATLVAKEDVAGLTRIKGVGKKTADQMLLDLCDKASEIAGGRKDLALGATLTPFKAPDPAEVNVADAIAALMSIGYTDKEAKKQVDRAREAVDARDLEAFVRAAIQG